MFTSVANWPACGTLDECAAACEVEAVAAIICGAAILLKKTSGKRICWRNNGPIVVGVNAI
jgi:hypothetical protein